MQKKQSSLSRILSYAGGHKNLTLLGCILSALSAILGLIPYVCVWLAARNVLESWPGLEGTSGGIDRDNGFREGIKKNENIEIVAANNADWLREKAITVAEEMLQTNDEIDLFLALNDPMAEGAYIAAKNAGREGDILFVGFDGLPTPDGGIRSVMDGRLSMTQVYPTGGAEAIESAYQLLVEGKELEKELTLQSEIVTPDNAEELLAKYSGSDDGAAEETEEKTEE